jgi:hypothetical protein
MKQRLLSRTFVKKGFVNLRSEEATIAYLENIKTYAREAKQVDLYFHSYNPSCACSFFTTLRRPFPTCYL